MCVSQDLLGSDWAVLSAQSGPADGAAAVSSCALRASSVACKEPVKDCLQQAGERSAAPWNGTESRSSTHTAAGQALRFRQLSSNDQACTPHPSTPNISQPNLASQHGRAVTEKQQKPCRAQDDFDDWDVDLADLDECDRQMGQQLPPLSPSPLTPSHVSSAKSLRPPTCGAIQRHREFSTNNQSFGSSSRTLPPHVQSPNPRPSFPSAPPQGPAVFTGLTATSPAPSPLSRTFNRSYHPQKTTPKGPSNQPRGLFETVSPAPSPSSVSSSTLRPHPLHTPVLTNRLVQLVSASSKIPKKRPHSEQLQPRTRRFPGPAGLLPQQVSVIHPLVSSAAAQLKYKLVTLHATHLMHLS